MSKVTSGRSKQAPLQTDKYFSGTALTDSVTYDTA